MEVRLYRDKAKVTLELMCVTISPKLLDESQGIWLKKGTNITEEQTEVTAGQKQVTSRQAKVTAGHTEVRLGEQHATHVRESGTLTSGPQ